MGKEAGKAKVIDQTKQFKATVIRIEHSMARIINMRERRISRSISVSFFLMVCLTISALANVWQGLRPDLPADFHIQLTTGHLGNAQIVNVPHSVEFSDEDREDFELRKAILEEESRITLKTVEDIMRPDPPPVAAAPVEQTPVEAVPVSQ